ncbi:type I DNA topoisomerase [Otoolea muris]|uniref:type I DNA topoisomerase n=1 Tax=Otoolea muris TaxID=2941515 RepID=UPI00203DBCD4|nr:type I DNA topoisomerase [Otoolea muris]
MSKNLVIVESPAKVKTIKKFLGSNYEVDASGGHVRDLPKSQLGIDIEHDYEPKYITIRGKGDILAKLRREVKKADKIYLATDPDREGEAISWHLIKALKLDEARDKKIYRISFNEITKNAVKTSLKEPRVIDMNLVDAQQARRMLDRMVGYLISPLLWTKVKRGLSAGRVQSVALRMICDREEEISSFIPEEYWNLEASLKAKGSKRKLSAKYYGTKDGRQAIHNKEELDAIVKDLEGCSYTVSEVKKGERIKRAPIPFTTSTMQQEAAKTLNFSTQKTMRLAQQLYEGVDIKGRGTVGLITYLRTDSTRVAAEADAAARAFIGEQYGNDYVSQGGQEKKTDAKIQDAHEAIRPTDITLTPVQVKESLGRDLFRLYQLIWKRFTASRMQPAVYETTSVKVAAGERLFSLSASLIKFDGFLSVYMQDEDKEEGGILTETLEKGMELGLVELVSSQHFTQPPAHFTEASLVKAMEEQGIGRPSTYAPTITTIIARRYVAKENKNLYVTELGEVVNGMMKQAFPSIVDLAFTANMEYLLDGIGDGSVQWKTVIENFYPDLAEAVKEAEDKLDAVKIADEVTEEICENCGRNMVIKYGPHGRFLACPGFPDCKNTRPYLEKIGVACPKCGKDIVLRKTKKGRKYYGCVDNPDCDFMSWQKPSKEVCPECGSMMLEKGNKLLCSDKNCGFVQAKTED